LPYHVARNVGAADATQLVNAGTGSLTRRRGARTIRRAMGRVVVP
jgi:hypothetical protein